MSLSDFIRRFFLFTSTVATMFNTASIPVQSLTGDLVTEPKSYHRPQQRRFPCLSDSHQLGGLCRVAANFIVSYHYDTCLAFALISLTLVPSGNQQHRKSARRCIPRALDTSCPCAPHSSVEAVFLLLHTIS